MTSTRHNRVFMHSEFGAMRIQNFHVHLLSRRRPGTPVKGLWKPRSRAADGPWRNQGCSGIPGPTNRRAQSHHEAPDLIAGDTHRPYQDAASVSCPVGRRRKEAEEFPPIDAAMLWRGHASDRQGRVIEPLAAAGTTAVIRAKATAIFQY